MIKLSVLSGMSPPPSELSTVIRISQLIHLPSNPDRDRDWYSNSHLQDELESWNTNMILPEETQRRVRGLLATAQHDLDTMDGEIYRASQSDAPHEFIVGLLERREQLSGRQKIMRVAVAPLKRIPPEILGRIFRFYTGDRVFLPPKPDSNPWKLGHVSSQWRLVLWRNSEVWGCLEFSLPHDFSERYDVVGNLSNTRNLFQDILHRYTALFSLSILNHTITPVMDLIAPASRRLKSLLIKRIPYRALRPFLALPSESLPFLEKLTLDVYYDSASSGPPFNWGASSLEAAPALRHVDFSLIHPNAFTTELSAGNPLVHLTLLPWSQLENLMLDAVQVPWTTAHAFLRRCTSLTRCHLTIASASDPPIAISVISLTSLRRLRLTQLGVIDWEKILHPFNLPNLCCLQLDATRPCSQMALVDPTTFHGAIASLILRSGCELDSLSIGGDLDPRIGAHVATPNLETLLEGCPTLASFTGSLTLPPNIFTSMRSEAAIFLPHLQVLNVWLEPSGLQALVDLLNCHIHFREGQSLPFYTGSIKCATVYCHPSPGYELAFESYRNSSWMYLVANLNISVTCMGGDGRTLGYDSSDDESDGI